MEHQPVQPAGRGVVRVSVAACLALSFQLAAHANTACDSDAPFEGSTTNNFGMLAFHMNGKAFGSSSKPDQADNGIDFSSVKVEVLPK